MHSTIKSPDEFNKYLNSELSVVVEELEIQRKGSEKYVIVLWVLGLGIPLAYMVYNFYNTFNNNNQTATTPEDYQPNYLMYILPIVLVMGGYYVVYFLIIKPKMMKNASSTSYNFKIDVFEKMVKFINPDIKYVQHGHIGLNDFVESGLFKEKNYAINGNDQIVGKYNGVPFQYCDLTVSYQRSFSNKNSSPDDVFTGQYFIAKFNKSFGSPLYIIPKIGFRGTLADNEISLHTDYLGEKVLLEDPEFSKMFEVYGSDQVEARYILTPSFMQRIKDLTNRTQGRYYIAFNNQKITVANNNKSDFFEASVFTSMTDNNHQLLMNFYKDLCDQFAIIDELKLNINIWKTNNT